MTFSESIKTCFKKAFVFSGRADRSEFWWFYLFYLLISGGSYLVSNTAYWITFLAFFPSCTSVSVRRLHDIGKSGWWYLINLIPLIGWILFYAWMIMEGETERNAYGQPSDGKFTHYIP